MFHSCKKLLPRVKMFLIRKNIPKILVLIMFGIGNLFYVRCTGNGYGFQCILKLKVYNKIEILITFWAELEISWLFRCLGVIHPPLMGCHVYDIKPYLPVRRKFRRSGDCEVPVHCNYFQVHCCLEWKYKLVGSSTRSVCKLFPFQMIT